MPLRAKGRIVPEVVAALSHDGWPQNRQQELELTSECLEQLFPSMSNIPLCADHKDHLPIGRVIRPYKDEEGAACVEFEVDDTPSGRFVQNLIDQKVVYGLSLKHDPNPPMKSIEVSVCKVPARAGSYVTEIISPDAYPAVAASAGRADSLGWLKLRVASAVVAGSEASPLEVRYLRFRKEVSATATTATTPDKKVAEVAEALDVKETVEEAQKRDGYVYMKKEDASVATTAATTPQELPKETKQQVNTNETLPVQPAPQVPSFLNGDHVPVAFLPRSFFASLPAAGPPPPTPTAMDMDEKKGAPPPVAYKQIPTRFVDTDAMQSQLDREAAELLNEHRSPIAAGGVKVPMGMVSEIVERTGAFDVAQSMNWDAQLNSRTMAPQDERAMRQQQATPHPTPPKQEQQQQQPQQQQQQNQNQQTPQQQMAPPGTVKNEEGNNTGSVGGGNGEQKPAEQEDDNMQPADAINLLVNKKNTFMNYKTRVKMANAVDSLTSENERLRKMLEEKSTTFDHFKETVDTFLPFVKAYADKKRTGEQLSDEESAYMQSDGFQAFVNSDRGRREIAASNCTPDDFVSPMLHRQAQLLMQKYNKTNVSGNDHLSEADRYRGSVAASHQNQRMDTPRPMVAASGEELQRQKGIEPYILLDGRRPLVAASELPAEVQHSAFSDMETRPAVSASAYTGVEVRNEEDPYGDYNWPKLDEQYFRAAVSAARRSDEPDPDGHARWRQEMREIYNSKVKPLSRVVAASAYLGGVAGAAKVRVPPFGSDAAYGWLTPQSFWNITDKEGKVDTLKSVRPVVINKNYQSLLAATRTSALTTTANTKIIFPRARA